MFIKQFLCVVELPLPQCEGKPAIYRQLLASSSLLATHLTLEIPCRYVFCNPENSFGEKLLYFDGFHLLVMNYGK